MTPLAYIGFFAITLLTDFAEQKMSPAASRWLGLISIAGATMAVLLSPFLAGRGYSRAAVGLGHIALLFWAIAAAESFATLVMALRKANFVWNSVTVWGFALVLWVGLYHAPGALGHAEGRRDRDPTISKLPLVQLPEEPTPAWRMLASDSSALFIARLTSDGTSPEVRVVALTHPSRILQPSSGTPAVQIATPTAPAHESP